MALQAMRNFFLMSDMEANTRSLQKTADVYLRRYQKQGELSDLSIAIQASMDAVHLTPDGHRTKPDRLLQLATCLREQFFDSKKEEDLELAFQTFQDAVKAAPDGHASRARCLQGLSASFKDKYERFGDRLDYLRAALQNSEEAAGLTPAGHPERAVNLHNNASCSRELFQKDGNQVNLEKSLKNAQEAVDLTARKDPQFLHSLARSHRERYQALGAEATAQDLNDAIQIMEEAQYLISEGPENQDLRAEVLHGLALCLGDRYTKQGTRSDLEKALHISQEAVDLTKEHHPKRPVYLGNLAMYFQARYHQWGNMGDLVAAVDKAREAVNLSEGSPNWVTHIRNLGVCLHERYGRYHDLRDLEEMLRVMEAALAVDLIQGPDRAACLLNLSAALTDRYERLGKLDDLDTALQKDKEGLEILPKTHGDRGKHLANLASGYMLRYQRLEDLRDLEAALKIYQEALEFTQNSPADKAHFLHLMAIAVTGRYMRLKEVKDLEDALKMDQQAVFLISKVDFHRVSYIMCLSVSFRNRYQRFRDPKDLESAVQYGQEALNLASEQDHPNLGLCQRTLANSLLLQYRNSELPEDLEAVHTHYSNSFKTYTSQPELSWTAALDWASISEEYQGPHCKSAYAIAFRLLPEILWIGHATPVRQEVIRRLNIGQATSRATRACINLSDLRSAVEIMEQGLATEFQQRLQLNTDISGEHGEELRRLSAQLSSGKAANPQRVVNERDELLKKIKEDPRHAHLFLPKPYDILCKAAERGPVIILNSHNDQCDGIIILASTSNPVHVPLPNVTLDQLKSQQTTLKQLLGSNGRTQGESESSGRLGKREKFTSKTQQEGLEDLLKWLWTSVVSPIYKALELHNIHNGRLWWLPTGSFTGLPLHASPPDHDLFIHSYTPTLGSLLESYNKKQPENVLKLGIVGVTHSGPSMVNTLKGVKEEIKKILSIVRPAQCLLGEKATADAVKHQLQDCSWVHLACHGKQDIIEPSKSHLLLYQGTLELETILRMALSNAEFVFLAACQTAMGDAELVNESFHLGGGFIAAGFRSVIGTLWAMDDRDGPVVAEMVYSHLFRDGRQPQASDTAEALHLAVRELRAKVPHVRWIPFIHMGV
ncbi:CHAT domain-containing protein, partial [Mycena vulgaris]